MSKNNHITFFKETWKNESASEVQESYWYHLIQKK